MKLPVFHAWSIIQQVYDQNTMLKAIIAAIFAACSADALGAAGREALPELGGQMDLVCHTAQATRTKAKTLRKCHAFLLLKRIMRKLLMTSVVLFAFVSVSVRLGLARHACLLGCLCVSVLGDCAVLCCCVVGDGTGCAGTTAVRCQSMVRGAPHTGRLDLCLHVSSIHTFCLQTKML